MLVPLSLTGRWPSHPEPSSTFEAAKTKTRSVK
jgi:hypothetical protein